jgi:hypothetical protein
MKNIFKEKNDMKSTKNTFFMSLMNTAVAGAHCPGQTPAHRATTSIVEGLFSVFLLSFPATGTESVQGVSAIDRIRSGPNIKLSLLNVCDYKTQTHCPENGSSSIFSCTIIERLFICLRMSVEPVAR